MMRDDEKNNRLIHADTSLCHYCQEASASVIIRKYNGGLFITHTCHRCDRSTTVEASDIPHLDESLIEARERRYEDASDDERPLGQVIEDLVGVVPDEIIDDMRVYAGLVAEEDEDET